MARMIPDYYPPNTSRGEKELFERLKSDKTTNDWDVYHSLNLPRHADKLEGEADFIIVVRHKGILCLEVKGATDIKVLDSGQWQYSNGPQSYTRPESPFAQAQGNMYAIRDEIRSKIPESRLTYYYGVLFPFAEKQDIERNIGGAEWHDWVLIDSKTLRENTIRGAVDQVIEGWRAYYTASNAQFYDPLINYPSNDLETLQIRNILRPKVEFYQSPAQRLENSASEIKSYTEEQFTVLDALRDNPRVLVSGPAGTGKTLIALEAAKRFSNEGKQTLLCCYNAQLAQWMQNQSEETVNLDISTLHHSMMTFSKAPIDGDANDYWGEILPEAATLGALDLESPPYDVIIMDEAQDLIADNYLGFIDAILKNGLQEGDCWIFADPEHQNLYNANTDFKATLNEHGSFTSYSLSVNCRNTKNIVNCVEAITELKSPYKYIKRLDNPYEPQILYYENSEDQQSQLIDLLHKLQNDQFPHGQTVILSNKGQGCANLLINNPESPMVKELDNNLSMFNQLEKIPNKDSGNISGITSSEAPYAWSTTIRKFKGLESPSIIITDIDSFSVQQQELLYVGMTRATDHLFLLANKAIEKDLRHRIANLSNNT